MREAAWLGTRSTLHASIRCLFLIRRIGQGVTIRVVGALLHAGLEFGDPHLQRLDPSFQMLDGRLLLRDDLEQLQNQPADGRRGLLPIGSVKRLFCWKGKSRSHSAPYRVASLAALCVRNAAFIGKAPDNVEPEVQGVALAVAWERSPLKTYD
jgi:hypothetical protein